MRNLGISFDFFLFSTTWSRHVCGYQDLHLRNPTNFQKWKLDHPFPASLAARYRLLTQWGNQGYMVSTSVRLEVEVCSLGQAVVETVASYAQHPWSPVVWCGVPSGTNSELFTVGALWYDVIMVPDYMAQSGFPGNPVTCEVPFHNPFPTSIR